MPKPDFQIEMPARQPTESKFPRSPRFHEDFDAPFSEAIATASPTLHSGSSDGSVSPMSSAEDEVTKALRKLDGHDAPNVAAWASEASRASTTTNNSKFKQWARKSFALGRASRSDRLPTSKSSSSISEVENAASV